MSPQTKGDNRIHAAHAVEYAASVHCPICTHTVHATVQGQGRTVRVKPGQKCPRCASSLDAAYVLRFDRAA